MGREGKQESRNDVDFMYQPKRNKWEILPYKSTASKYDRRIGPFRTREEARRWAGKFGITFKKRSRKE